jgi:hypothetical protein
MPLVLVELREDDDEPMVVAGRSIRLVTKELHRESITMVTKREMPTLFCIT